MHIIALPAAQLWTRCYKKIFSTNTQSHENIKVFEQVDVPQFTQLILAWNATRPTKGHFRFWGVVRNNKTKVWSRHKMFDWGAGVQKSYAEKGHHGTEHVHVRLEIKQGTADGFKIIAEAIDGAPIELVRMLAVTMSNPEEMISEIGHFKKTDLRSVYVKGVTRQSQMLLNHKDASVLCSPTSTSMLLNYLSAQNVDSALFANAVFDTGLGVYGSWPFNTAAAYDWSDGQHFFYVTRLASFATLHSYLCRQIPVVVSIRCKNQCLVHQRRIPRAIY
jgi:hypothetical protein